MDLALGHFCQEKFRIDSDWLVWAKAFMTMANFGSDLLGCVDLFYPLPTLGTVERIIKFYGREGKRVP